MPVTEGLTAAWVIIIVYTIFWFALGAILGSKTKPSSSKGTMYERLNRRADYFMQIVDSGKYNQYTMREVKLLRKQIEDMYDPNSTRHKINYIDYNALEEKCKYIIQSYNTQEHDRIYIHKRY